MGLLSAVKREISYITQMRDILSKVDAVGPKSGLRVPDHIERTVDAYPDRVMAYTDEGEIRYAQFDAYANQVASWALAQGLKPGDCVALLMGNKWQYIAIWFGLSKVGVTASLLNNQLAGKSLAHCLNVGESAHLIVDADLFDNYTSACDHDCDAVVPWIYGDAPEGVASFTDTIAGCGDERPDTALRAEVKNSDTALKMFTSGTTGLPKAALVTHIRALYYLNAFAATSKSSLDDRMYLVLPLYHATGGLCGVGCALSYGGALIIRDRFSASAFWPDVKHFKATQFMYVGELCRFLVNSPEAPEEKEHSLRVAIGNGMRRDVWDAFQARFNLPWIIEFYGSTEGNVGLVNATNFPGAVGRVPGYLKSRFNVELVRFDIDTEMPVRDENGRCIVCGPDEVGEAVGRIDPNDSRFRFDGYGSKADTEKKILRDVFKPGDAWFRTGDLMSRDKLGHFFFVDRVGDTFRWKSENVATGEVAEALNVPGIEQANVYGVEVDGHAGRAGMAAIVGQPDAIDLDSLHAHVHDSLPAYARPLFLRLQEQTDTTGTFKFRKVDLVKDGFNPQKIDEPLFFDHPSLGRYVPLTPEIFGQIQDGSLRI